MLLLLLLLTSSLPVVWDTISLWFKVLWTPSADNVFKVLSRSNVAALGFCMGMACSAASFQRRSLFVSAFLCHADMGDVWRPTCHTNVSMEHNDSMFAIDDMPGSSQVLVTEATLTNTASIPESDSQAE